MVINYYKFFFFVLFLYLHQGLTMYKITKPWEEIKSDKRKKKKKKKNGYKL